MRVTGTDKYGIIRKNVLFQEVRNATQCPILIDINIQLVRSYSRVCTYNIIYKF